MTKEYFESKISTHRDDLTNEGYDVTGVSDDTMEELADGIKDGLMNVYWETLLAVADGLKIKRLK